MPGYTESSVPITMSQYSRNTDPILNLLINTYRIFFWISYQPMNICSDRLRDCSVQFRLTNTLWEKYHSFSPINLFLWMRYFLFNFTSFWNTYLCVYFPSVTEQLIKRNLPKRNFHETICLQIMQSWPNTWSIWMVLKCWKLWWVFR